MLVNWQFASIAESNQSLNGNPERLVQSPLLRILAYSPSIRSMPIRHTKCGAGMTRAHGWSLFDFVLGMDANSEAA
jgi:hypothetical protein